MSELKVGFPTESMHGHNLWINSTEALSNGQQVLSLPQMSMFKNITQYFLGDYNGLLPKRNYLETRGCFISHIGKSRGTQTQYCIVSFMSTARIQMYSTQLSSISKGGIMCYFL